MAFFSATLNFRVIANHLLVHPDTHPHQPLAVEQRHQPDATATQRRRSAAQLTDLRQLSSRVRNSPGLFLMGLSKTEVNLRRLLAAAPQQHNRTKLVHYITTLREQLEQLGSETTSEGLPSISKAKLNEYSENIEALAAKLADPVLEPEEDVDGKSVEESSSRTEHTGCSLSPSSELRRRFVKAPREAEGISQKNSEKDSAELVKLDAAAQAHIEKHRKLQEDLTDEMVALARQLKESSYSMNQSLQETEKILDSTEKAVEDSLASTSRVNTRAMQISSQSFKTTCFTWLAIFVMTCIFIMVVLLIRIT